MTPLPPGVPAEGGIRLVRPGESQPMGKVITMSDIAKASGVSQGAISSLLNDRDYGIRVSEKTREKVFKTCREMGYMPNDLRAVVRMYPELGELCFLSPKELGNLQADPFYSRVIQGALSTGEAGAISIAQFGGEEDFSAAQEHLPYPIKWGTASKFLYAGPVNTSLIQTVVKRGFPIMLVGSEYALPGVVSILPDYKEAAEKGLAYLFGLKHKEIAILSGPFGSTETAVVDLNRGVSSAFEKAGVSIQGQNILFGERTAESGFNSMEAIIARKKRPTAVFCFNDALACGAIAAAHRHGLRVPEDISILGCGDDSQARQSFPALSTVHLPAEEMGAQAVREIEAYLKEPLPTPAEPRRIVLGSRVVERESCR